MLFSTFEFIFGFLPVALAGYWVLARRTSARLWFLFVASLVFYKYTHQKLLDDFLLRS